MNSERTSNERNLNISEIFDWEERAQRRKHDNKLQTLTTKPPLPYSQRHPDRQRRKRRLNRPSHVITSIKNPGLTHKFEEQATELKRSRWLHTKERDNNHRPERLHRKHARAGQSNAADTNHFRSNKKETERGRSKRKGIRKGKKDSLFY